MDTESVRAAAERMRCGEPAYWAGKYGDMDGDTDIVARHILAETDERLADEEFFRSIGFVGLWRGEFGFGFELIGKDGKFSEVDFARTDPIVFHAVGRETDHATESARIFNPTRGQVLTALRLFGTPTGGTK